MAEKETQLKAALSAFLESNQSGAINPIEETPDCSVNIPQDVTSPPITAFAAASYEDEQRKEELMGLKLANVGKSDDNKLKRHYGYGLLGVLGVQLLIMNLVFVAVGVGCIHYEEWALHLYVAGTLAEIFALVLVVTKYLFPRPE